jgi:2'-5' RNA ligase
MTIRSFFAIPLNPLLVRRLADHADTLCSLDGGSLSPDSRIHWVDSGSYHLTLCFLGQITLDQVGALEQQAKEWLADQPVFAVQLARSGYLEVNPALSVVAAQADPQPELVQLQQRVAELVARVGIEVEEADFVPHITLGRLSVQPQSAALMAADSRSWPNLDLRVSVDSLVLYQSKPGDHGSIYSPLFKTQLVGSHCRQNPPALNATA